MSSDVSPTVVVIGSLSMDFTAFARDLPRLGETVIGDGFTMVPGGKGENQAIAAARQNAPTAMIGSIGTDLLGDQILETLHADQVDAELVHRSADLKTGIAHITVDGAGDNSIIVVPLANSGLTPALVDRAAPAIEAAKVLLVQLEIPMESVAHALRLARGARTITILNPAPARELSDELLALVDVLVPNETEAASLTSQHVSTVEEAEAAAEVLVQRGVGEVVVTLGEQGAIHHAGGQTTVIKPYDVEPVDSTAAGDAFCGAFAAGLARGDEVREALECAAAAGALAVTVEGASPSLPTSDDVERLRSGRR